MVCEVVKNCRVTEGERAYLEDGGFPVLKQPTVKLERSRAKKSQVIDRLEQHFLEYFSQGCAGKSRP